MPEWTKAQRAAIETRDKNILVAAAAGSGKTAVLVERILSLILSGECDVDELLVMTFTDAAAREMRQRVEKALEKALEKARTPEEAARIERQLVLLTGASISTMHKFCLQVLRRHFEAIDLDPQFRLGGQQELALLRQDVMADLFDASYEQGTSEFLQFVSDYGDDHGDAALHALVEQLFLFSLSQPFPDAWLQKQAGAFDLPDGTQLTSTVWYPVIRSEIARTLEKASAVLDDMMQEAEAAGADAYLETFREDRVLVQSLMQALAAESWQILSDAFSTCSFSRLPTDRQLDDTVKKHLQELRKDLKTVITNLSAKYFRETEAELMDDLRHAAPDMRELVRLTLAFHAAYQQAKKERALADFSDLEHFALAVLIDHEASRTDDALPPSAIARALQEKYHEVLVDEYQDTNGVQEAIVSLVTRQEPPNLFVVGDVKQSIYRFRLADPTLFLRKYQTYPEQKETCARIDLSQNFRSRPAVLAAINYIFAQVMVPDTMELAYDDAAALHPGLPYPEAEGPTLEGPQELALLYQANRADAEDDADTQEGGEAEASSSLEREAAYIAQRIQAFIAAGTLVYHKEDEAYHPISYRDIVILMRSVTGKAEQVLEVLRAHGIPAYAASDAGYFKAQEVRCMLSLLSILDNARQDIPLAAVLLSPIGTFSLSEMASVRLAEPEGDIFTALLTAANPEKKLSPSLQKKAEAFLGRLSHWRALAQALSVPELIWQLYRETGYYDYVGGLPGGLLKQANLRMLVDRAAEYEQTNFRGLFRFLRFVERMRAMDTDLAAARTLGESEDVVRIMTIHGSKGLEFPLVFVANLGGQFNLRDSREKVLMHRELGLGPYAVNAELAVRYATFARHAVAARIVQESKAEELRLLYVALTRARERLILVGSVKDETALAHRASVWGRAAMRKEVALPGYISLDVNSFLDWVGTALMHHPACTELRQLAGLPAVLPAFSNLQEGAAWQVSCVPSTVLPTSQQMQAPEDEVLATVRGGKPLPESRQRAAVETLLSWTYADHGLEKIPAKLSVSELKQRFAEREAREEGRIFLTQEKRTPWKRPRFLRESAGLTGTEFGSLMHSVMQYLDVHGDCSEQGIRSQLAFMAERELISPEDVPAVRVADIAKIFASPLGNELRHARRIYRELPFSRLLPACRFYPAAEASAELLVQGIIDLLFETEEGRLILVDYKTDSDTRPEIIRSRYALQLDLYSEAVAAILGQPVAERCLYMLHDGSLLTL